MTNYVLGFCFTPDFEHVVLIKKAKPEWQAGLLNGLGGHVEASDHSEGAAMRREFREESGLDIRDWTMFARMKGTVGFNVACFWATSSRDYLQSPVWEEEEPVNLWYLNALLHNYKKLMLPNLPWLMAMAKAHAEFDQPIIEINYP